MTYQPVDAIEVWMWGRRVGALAENPRSGWYAFRFDPEWVAGGVEIAPLHMPLDEHRTYEFRDLDPTTFRRLPPAIADALPDRFGNALVDRWMAEQGVGTDQFTVLDRLAYAADRAIGALEFRPPALPPDAYQPTAVQLADIVIAARAAVFGDTAAHIDQASIEQLILVGSSAGGARPKAVVAYHPTTGQVRSAYRDLPDGFEHWLFKLDGAGARALDGHSTGLGDGEEFGVIEYAYHLMASAAGVMMSRCELLPEGPRRHFITRRFDRTDDGTKRQAITLCGIAHLDFNLIGAHSYDQYLETVSQLNCGLDALAEAYRRMVFNVAAANCDDHTKNVAFLLRPDEGWELAPAYDVTFAHDPANTWTKQHLMSVNGKTLGVTLDDLYAVGARRDVPGYRKIVREVLAAVDAWPDFASPAGVSVGNTDRIGGVLAEHRPG